MNIDPYPVTKTNDCRTCGTADNGYCKLCETRTKTIRTAFSEYRIAQLEAAIEQHRFTVGHAYGIGSFKAQHAANMALWAVVSVEPVEKPSVFPETIEETGLARPAMMEEIE
jgi:hypothetical protein